MEREKYKRAKQKIAFLREEANHAASANKPLEVIGESEDSILLEQLLEEKEQWAKEREELRGVLAVELGEAMASRARVASRTTTPNGSLEGSLEPR